MNDKVKRVLRTIGVWLPAIPLIVAFVPQGLAKFSDASGWAVAFRHWGYPDWFRMTIGVIELTAALLIISGRFAAFGAILIIIVMLGGMGTHIAFDGGRHLTSELGPLIFATIVLIVRRKQLAMLRRDPAAR